MHGGDDMKKIMLWMMICLLLVGCGSSYPRDERKGEIIQITLDEAIAKME